MKNKVWIILIILAIIVGVVVFARNRSSSSLISPGTNKTTTQVAAREVPNATPNAPKTYNYDAKTDLKAELNSINPKILESDFE